MGARKQRPAIFRLDATHITGKTGAMTDLRAIATAYLWQLPYLFTSYSYEVGNSSLAGERRV